MIITDRNETTSPTNQEIEAPNGPLVEFPEFSDTPNYELLTERELDVDPPETEKEPSESRGHESFDKIDADSSDSEEESEKRESSSYSRAPSPRRKAADLYRKIFTVAR